KLGGNGTIGGLTLVNGVLAPGGSIGVLTFTSDLTFAPNSTAEFELSAAPMTNDAALVFGTVTYAGTLSVVNTGVELLEAGENFNLFEAGFYSGSLSDFSLPSVDEGLDWNTSQLTVDGRIWVVRTTPPVITRTTRSGDDFIFNGTGGTPNWPYYVLSSTNA